MHARFFSVQLASLHLSGRADNLIPASTKLRHSVSPYRKEQGYLAHKKQPPPRTLQKDDAQSPMVVLGGGGTFL